MIAWMGLAMMVSTRMFLGGVVQLSRDRSLADQMPVPGSPMCRLLATFAGDNRRLERISGQHPPSVPREGQAGAGDWTSLLAGLVGVAHWHVIKRSEKKCVVEVMCRMAHGFLEQAEQLLLRSRGGMVLNTAFLERLNGTFRVTALD